MIAETISTEAAQRFYDRLGAGHDRAEIYEGQAKQRGLVRLEPQPGQQILNVGVGTGREHRLIQAKVGPTGRAFGLDLSPVMLHLAARRTGAPLCRADLRAVPFPPAMFDALFSSYVLDLIPGLDLPTVLPTFRSLLKPGGRLVLVSLTEGVDLPSRTLVALWKTAYRLNPVWCGGCRPLQLAAAVEAAGFSQVSREVVVQLGVPSEVVTAIA